MLFDNGGHKTKRLVIISDLHCGHRSGLTPPAWQYSECDDDEIKAKYGEFQRILWKWYIESLPHPIDTLVVNGDAIDGKGEKSGGTELITADRRLQVKIAAEAIQEAHAKRVFVIKGTGYHTGRDEDWEEVLGDTVEAYHVASHEWIDAEGVCFDFRHKTSSSVIPHGRYTGPNRAALWNGIWHQRGMQPLANVYVRSHVHYYSYSGDARKLVVTSPALQGWTKFGSNECEGTNDIGFLQFDCEGGKYEWQAHLLDMQFMAAQALPA
jgi:hypothetical protein